MCILSRFNHVQLFATLWTADCQGLLSIGFSRKVYQNGLSCPPSGDLPDPGMEHASPALQVDSLPLRHQGRPVVVVQSLSHVQLFATPWTEVCQASLSFTISQSLLKLMYIKSVMPSKCLILCHPLLILPLVFPSIRVFPNELALRIRCFVVYCFVVFYPKSILWPDPSVVPTFGHLWMFTL